jgi:drug/metabolite transporter, DME family
MRPKRGRLRRRGPALRANPSSSAASIGIAAVAGAAALWAIAATVARGLFEDGVAPLDLAASRSIVAGLGLAVLSARSARSKASISTFHLISLGLAIALVNAAYYLAIDRLAVAIAVVIQYTAPALVVSWVALRSRRAPSTVVLVAVTGAVAGVALVAELPAGDFGTLDGIGIAFALASAVLFATYTLLSEGAAAVYGPLGALARAFAVASVLWIAYLVPAGWPSELVASGNWPRVLFVGILGTLAPFLLYVWGIRRVAAERATIAATLEPVLAAAVAWTWLGQTLSLMQIAGGTLVIATVFLLQTSHDRPVVAPEP